MRCLIVDDEPPARAVLENYIRQMQGLSLTASCANAIQALGILQRDPIELIFLDIQMPEISGLQMVESLMHRPKVILTTAHAEYALDAYNLDIIDYLLKPIAFERFARAVEKARRLQDPLSGKKTNTRESPEYLFFRADRKLHKVLLKDIVFVEGLSNYLKLLLVDRTLVIRETMADMERRLPSDQFIRVHKSYIVRLDRILYIEGNLISTERGGIPIGESWKEEFMRKIYEDLSNV